MSVFGYTDNTVRVLSPEEFDSRLSRQPFHYLTTHLYRLQRPGPDRLFGVTRLVNAGGWTAEIHWQAELGRTVLSLHIPTTDDGCPSVAIRDERLQPVRIRLPRSPRWQDPLSLIDPVGDPRFARGWDCRVLQVVEADPGAYADRVH